jgi:hypothetical protein
LSKRVNALGQLEGIVTAIDLLQYMEHEDLPEDEFDFYVPAGPTATINSNGDMVVPLESFDDINVDDELFAVLGYSVRTGRVAVELVNGDQELPVGARAAHVVTNRLVIPAKDFLEHHRISCNDVKPLRVSSDRKNGFVVFSVKELIKPWIPVFAR